jgi:hypothetical protein
MTRTEPWAHGGLPWLSGHLYKVDNDQWPVVHELLRRWNYAKPDKTKPRR